MLMNDQERKELKEDLIREIRILENSLEMYKKTFSEMKARGSSIMTTETVERCMKEVEDQITDAREVLEHEGKADFEKVANDHFIYWSVKDIRKSYSEKEIKKVDKRLNPKVVEELGMRDFYKFSPFFKHRFFVEFGTNDIPYYCVSSVRYADGNLIIKFRDSEEFFTPEYFDVHGKDFKDRNVKVFWLDQYGIKRAVAEFTGVRFMTYILEPLAYADDNPQGTEVSFRYKNVNHKRLNATNKKQGGSKANSKKEKDNPGKETTPKVRNLKIGR